jgi:Ca2+-binding RTX toxin-like protein
MLQSSWLQFLYVRMRVSYRNSSRTRRFGLSRRAVAHAEVLEDRALLTSATLLIEPPGEPIDEGHTASLWGTIESEQPLDGFTLLIDWGDGSPTDSYIGTSGEDSFFVWHPYLDDDPTSTPSDIYNVDFTLQYDGGSDTEQIDITVTNVAPTLSDFQVPHTGELGALLNLSVTTSDPGPNDIVRTIWTIEQPDQTVLTIAGESVQFTPNLAGEYTITAIASDDDLGVTRDVASLFVGDTFILMPDGNLIINDEAQGGKMDALTIEFDETTNEVVVTDPNAFMMNSVGTRISDHEVRVPADSISGGQIIVNTGAGNDSLLLDFSSGLPATGSTLVFNGGADDDRLDMTGATIGVLTHVMTSANGGSIDLDGRQVTYDGLEPIGDNLNATHRAFHFVESNDVVTVGDDGIIGNGISRISSVASSETIDFVNPTGSLTVNAGSGDDTVTLENMDAQFSTSVRFVVNGEAGNDRLTGSVRADVLNGGSGDDTLNGQQGDDILDGQSGNDTLYGGAGKDTLTGSAGNDRLKGQGSTDTIFEVGDNDFVLTNRTLTGNGTDSLVAPNRIILIGGDGDNTIDARSFSIGGVTILGGGGDDVLHGSRRADLIEGNDGNDLVNGAQGYDRLDGGSGNDTLYGGSGRDTLTGGLGDDDLHGQGSQDTLREFVDSDVLLSDTEMSGLGTDSIDGIEQAYLTGGVGDNLFDARSFTLGSVTLDGGAGNDSLHGGRRDDVIFGGVGDDLVNGSNGNDSLLGGNGNDRLFGGAGRDALVGQAGNDYVKGQGSTDTLAGGSGSGADSGDRVIGSANEIDETFTLDFDDLLA